MTSSTLKDNGRMPRKTLSTQLDRLDEILDGLADNLNDAVAGAARAAVLRVVRDAVQDGVRDALDAAQPAPSSPVPPPVSSPKPTTSWTDKIKAAWATVKQALVAAILPALGGVRRCWAWGMAKLRKLLAASGGWWTSLAQGVRGVGAVLAQVAQVLWQHRRLAGMALGVGLVTWLGSYLAGPLAASLLNGLCSAVLTVGGLAALSLWRLLNSANWQ